MKICIQSRAHLLERTGAQSQIIVDIPKARLNAAPLPNEFFDVLVSRDGKVFQSCKVCLLGDGRSFLIGNEVVRISRKLISQKNDVFRVLLGFMQDSQAFQAKIIRVVSPRKRTVSNTVTEIKSPMTGKVLTVNACLGKSVSEGEILLTIEAMKMENRILAEYAGQIKAMNVTAGQTVTSGDFLLAIEPVKADESDSGV